MTRSRYLLLLLVALYYCNMSKQCLKQYYVRSLPLWKRNITSSFHLFSMYPSVLYLFHVLLLVIIVILRSLLFLLSFIKYFVTLLKNTNSKKKNTKLHNTHTHTHPHKNPTHQHTTHSKKLTLKTTNIFL